MEIWLSLLAMAIIAAWWYHALRLRENATAHARDVCERHGLQLLDDSVALHRLHVSWRHRVLRVVREYRFDTSLGGGDREVASITLLGDRIVASSVPWREDPGSDAPAPAPRTFRDIPSAPADAGAGGNVVSIDRARRTLH